MMGLPLAFAAPLALIAIVALPALYYLLRVTPPRPQQVPFPPLRLMLDLAPRQETPARTPWWLLALRLLVAFCIILAMAGPIWNPLSAGASGAGPLVLIVDDGWPAAPSWQRRMLVATQRVEAAGREGRPVAVVATADGGREIVPGDAQKALDRLRAIKPVPHIPDRLATVTALERFVANRPDSSLVWLADGVERGHARDFAEKLAGLTKDLTLVTDPAPVRGLANPRNGSNGLEVDVMRSANAGIAAGSVRALDLKGVPIAEAPFSFGGIDKAVARFDLPVEMRNEMARLEIVGDHSAGAVSLLDERWKRRRVGIISGETADVSQPLLAPNYYVAKALAPFADLREARAGTADPIAALLDEHVAAIVLADIGVVAGPTHDRLAHFVEEGGLLLRFAGSRLAGASDDLVPVKLRRGGRVLGGSLSWDTPKKLAPFDAQSPFVGLRAPDEVTITRQVLAEPEPGLPGKTWAQLADGTPLVTAAKRGKGTLVLFHITADTTWSNLPLSGLFVDMLRKIVALSNEPSAAGDKTATAGQAAKIDTVAPTRTLDGFGVLGAPPLSAKPIPVNFDNVGDAEHPPGFYGPPDALLAVNTLGARDTLAAANYSGLTFKTEPLDAAEPIDLRPWLAGAAFLLFALDALASLWLNAGLRWRRAAPAALLVALGFIVVWQPEPAAAQGKPDAAKSEAPKSDAPKSDAPISQRDLAAALTTRIAYVASGDTRVDEASRQGLIALSRVLGSRTSLNPGEPVAVDPGRDELGFYPLLYWPIVADKPQPPSATVAKVSAFMKQGGTIIFDTRDAMAQRPNGPPTPEGRWLRALLNDVDVPELEPIPADHVVTKTFYLIDNFIGRYTGGQTWIEALPPAAADGSARPARSGDGVSPIVITSNDLAAGWASDRDGESLYSLIPGGTRQHELSLRGGVNLVMYTLTGNYKADQVHVRDLLERLAH